MRKIYMKTVSFFVLALFVFCSCENDFFYYQDIPRVRLEGPSMWALGTDSLLFTFLTFPESVQSYEMEMTLYIMGSVEDHDRMAYIVVVDEYTTADSSQYTFPSEVIIPSNQMQVTFSVELRRSIDLQEKTVQLYIQIIDSEDFKVGVNEQNHFLLRWNDILSRPSNWNELSEFFGTYSNVKYRFILNTLALTEIDTDLTSWAQLMSYKAQLVVALDEYNALNPGNPLQDEYGQYVSFEY